MKRLILSFSLLLTLSLPLMFISACDDVEELVAFFVTVEPDDYNFTVDSTSTSPGKAETVLFQTSFSFDLDSILEAHEVSSGMIGGCWFQRLAVAIDSPAVATFNFVDSFRVTVSNDSLFSTETEVAQIVIVDPAVTIVELNVYNLDVVAMMQGQEIWVRLYGGLPIPIPYPAIYMHLSSRVKLRVEPLE